jgi:membrane protease YdiL (CAAX protease family)
LLLLLNIVKPGDDISNATTITASYTNRYILAGMLLVTAVAEEFLFRGFIMQTLRRRTRDSVAIIITAALFGLSHILYLQPYTVAITMIMGLLLGYVVVKTNSLLTGITAHSFYNILLLVLLISI